MKRFVAGLLCGLVLTLSFGASASNMVAQYASFKFMVNGKLVEPNATPIAINGKSYLPIRAFAELLDIPIDYDEVDNMIILGSRPLFREYTATRDSIIVDVRDTGQLPVQYDGRIYGHLFYVGTLLGAEKNDIYWDDATNTVTYHFNHMEVSVSPIGVSLDGIQKSDSGILTLDGSPLIEIIPVVESIGWQIEITDSEILIITTP